MGRKLALLIGNSRYDDPGLARLQAADVDVREIAHVLRHPEIGEFDEVTELPNQGLAVVRRSIAQFFRQGKKDDLLVFYFSGHGVKDENGHLYLAVRDTELPLLSGTAIESAFITAQMDRSFSRRQVLILDCCHSGAFAAGAKGAAQSVGVGPAFEGSGYGHVVLTATDATQYAWEGDQIIGESDKSVFTHYLLEGLRTGEADGDGDGQITIDELYDYVFEHVVKETPRQTPGKWSYKQQGEIVIAQSLQSARAVPLSLELQALVDSPLARLRAEAIPELADLLRGQHRGLALAARGALERLCADDSRKVSAAAEEVLATLEPLPTTETAGLSANAAAAAAEEAVRTEIAELIREAEIDEAAQERERIEREVEQRLAIEEATHRQELERLARARHQQVTELLATAEKTASHRAAIAVLEDVIELDPEHVAASQQLARRTAALDRETKEQEAREQARLEGLETERQEKEARTRAETVRIPRERLVAAPTTVHSVRTPWWRARATYTAFAATVVLAALVPYLATNGDVSTTPSVATPRSDVVLRPDQRVESRPVTPPITQTPELTPPAPRPAPATPTRPRTGSPGVKESPVTVPVPTPIPTSIPAPVPAPAATPPPQPNVDLQAQEKRLQQVRQLLDRALGLFDTGQYGEALRQIDDALKVDPKNTEALSLRQKATSAQEFEGKLRK